MWFYFYGIIRVASRFIKDLAPGTVFLIDRQSHRHQFNSVNCCLLKARHLFAESALDKLFISQYRQL